MEAGNYTGKIQNIESRFQSCSINAFKRSFENSVHSDYVIELPNPSGRNVEVFSVTEYSMMEAGACR